MTLQKLSGFSAPKPALEQYATPAVFAAPLLYHAAEEGTIEGKKVLDLGCGTGMLACGASLLGAAQVVGIDLDQAALRTAQANAALVDAEADFVCGELGPSFPCKPLTFDTVVMNPPFGAQRKHADRPFIDCALASADVVYGIFNTGSHSFIEKYIAGRGRITGTMRGSFVIPRTFAFHRHDRLEISVEVMRIERN